MDVKEQEQMEQIFKEIEAYRSHALFALAKQKYLELMELVENSDRLHKDALLDEISRQIGSIVNAERRQYEQKNVDG